MSPTGNDLDEHEHRGLLEETDSSTEFTDSELLCGIAKNDESAFEVLYDRYSPTLYAICLRILRHDVEAREVLSEVFLEVWEKASRYDYQRGSIQAFLSTLARCRSIDRLRANTSKTFSQTRLSELWYFALSHTTTLAPQEQLERSEEITVLRDAMLKLNELQREALILAYFDGRTHTEISQSLKIPLGTAKTAIRRGITILREYIAGVKNQEVEQ